MALTPQQQSAYLKATAICSRGEICSYDILEKLRKWGLEEEDAQEVINHLKEEKYIDDERFARAYVKDKFRFNHWGRQKIAFMLHAKKISREIQEAAFDEIEDEPYTGQLIQLLENKAKTIKSDDPYDRRNKLMRFAMGRGFETDKIFAAFKILGL
ncbi:MAG TPA: regulatory protein RecX [Prolixibacteraceae bacterium]|nr:regulatory protein RecX [Prolixibacteraceae bacterium]